MNAKQNKIEQINAHQEMDETPKILEYVETPKGTSNGSQSDPCHEDHSLNYF